MLTVRALLWCVRAGDWFAFRAQGCLLPCSYSQGSQEKYPLRLYGRGLQIPLLAIWLLGPLRHQGKRGIFYLDDLLILSHSEEVVRREIIAVIEHLSFLGFAINLEKSSLLPCRQLVYLGLSLDSATMTARLSPPRRDALLLALTRIRVGR